MSALTKRARLTKHTKQVLISILWGAFVLLLAGAIGTHIVVGQAPKPAPPAPQARTAPISPNVQAEFLIASQAAAFIRAQAEDNLKPINAKIESLRAQACKDAKFPKCQFFQDPQGKLAVQEVK